MELKVHINIIPYILLSEHKNPFMFNKILRNIIN